MPKFTKKQKAPLTLDEQIIAAQTRVAASMDIFKQAKKEVSAAQADLKAVISHAQSEINKYNVIIDNAVQESTYNEKIENKLAEFTE